MTEGILVLEDGQESAGWVFGAEQRVSTGEVVFHTAMTGYQEIISDPSYSGQIVTFTYPHIGNYGTNPDNLESSGAMARGIIVRDYNDTASNFQSTETLDAWLKSQDISGITGIDTRALTRHLRERGALRAAFGTLDSKALLEAALAEPSTSAVDHVGLVTTDKTYVVGSGKQTVVAMDFGIKKSILRQLSSFAKVIVVPARTTAEEILGHNPDGIFLSNGPGDPETLTSVIDEIKKLLGQKPIFGICLGHQLLAHTLGGKTEKLVYGHHGGNHPVKNLTNNKIEITSQNHNFAVVESSLKGAVVTHRNLNDQVVEGFRSTKYQAFSVQHHPEAGPGPSDAFYLFDDFKNMMGAR
jgi:carbamoyl-phosphate synthase small subunit